jgi:type I restriction enzyme S subunit
MSEETELPESWSVTTLGELGTWSSGGTPSRSKPSYYGGTIPWVKTGELRDCRLTVAEEAITEEGLANSSAKVFPPGTLLVAMYGATIGQLAVLEIPAATNQACAALLAQGEIRKLIPYLFYYIQSQRHALKSIGQGGAQPNISQAIIKNYRVPIAPLIEQSRIVEALESYFTRLDDAMSTMERVGRNLTRYRASLLKAAVEGRLVPTEATLAKQEGRAYEPASILLERVLAERRRRWSEFGKKGKYQEPAPPDITNLPNLPEGWCWTSLDAVALGLDGGNAATATDVPSPRKILTSRAVRQGFVDFTDVRFLPEDAEQKTNPYLMPGDLLFTRLSGTLDYVGNCAVVPDDAPSNIEFPDRIFRVRCVSLVSRRYIQHCFGDKMLRRHLEKAAKSTAGHQRISLSDLRAYAIPLPPLSEQQRIATEIDRGLSVALNLDATAHSNLIRCQRQRQAVLKWAFEGKLADQIPGDEPASVLLERIKAERRLAKPAKATRSQRGTAKKQVRA